MSNDDDLAEQLERRMCGGSAKTVVQQRIVGIATQFAKQARAEKVEQEREHRRRQAVASGEVLASLTHELQDEADDGLGEASIADDLDDLLRRDTDPA